MTAEPAGGASVIDAPETTTEAETQPQPGEATAGEPSASDVASSDRLRAILEDEGLPAEEVANLTKPTKGQSHADEAPESHQAPEGVATGKTTDPAKAAPKPKSKGPETAGEEDAPLNEKEHADNPLLPRVHKLTAQKKALQAQLDQVSRAQRPTPTAEDPLADVESPEEMEAAIREYRDMRYWAEMNPDGKIGVVVGKDAKGNDVTKDFSADDMARIRAEAGRILDEHVPQRIGILREQSLHEQVAKERLPEMFEEGTEANKFYKNALKDLPGLRNLPGMPNMIRWAYIGLQADIAANGKNGANGNGKTAVTTDPKVAPFLKNHPPMAPGAPETRVPSGGADGAEKVTQAKERVEAGEGGEEAETAFVGALRSRQTPRTGAVRI